MNDLERCVLDTTAPTHDTTSRASPARHPLVDRGGVAVLTIALLGFFAPAAAWTELGGPIPAAIGRLPFELAMLTAAALLALILPLAQIVLQIRAIGGDAVRGNREELPASTGAVGRVARAHTNLVESLVPFAAVVLMSQRLGLSSRACAAASATYLAARVVHAVTYALGIVVVRSAAFYVGLVATAFLAVQLLVFR